MAKITNLGVLYASGKKWCAKAEENGRKSEIVVVNTELHL